MSHLLQKALTQKDEMNVKKTNFRGLKKNSTVLSEKQQHWLVNSSSVKTFINSQIKI